MGKAYFIKGDHYARFDTEGNRVDDGYPRAMSAGWTGLVEAGFDSPDTVVDLGTGRLYVFKGDVYGRVDQNANKLDDGYPAYIAGNWPGMAEAGFGDALDAALNHGNGKVYFFRGAHYVRYDIATDRVDDGYPLPISGNWPGLEEIGFGEGLDGALSWGNGKVYFFRGGQYVRYDLATNRADDGYPLPVAGYWPGLAEAGFGDGLNAMWVKLAVGGSGGGGGGATPGFSGDEGGGWVRLHLSDGTDELRVGGTLAWRNNNPGNLLPGRIPYKTAVAVDRRGLAIFPSYAHGWAALREVLKSSTYGPLSIADAMAKYAPSGHGGNDPARYATLIRQQTGLEPTTVLNTLGHADLDRFMGAIKTVEGFREGTVYQRGDAAVPAELAPLFT